MDMNTPHDTSPPCHYESTILSHNTTFLIQQTKQDAFNYMGQLEGWCTKSKASILIDFIFMLHPKTIVEIGVWGGKSLIPMAHALKIKGRGVIYGIDSWDSKESAEGMDQVNSEWWGKVDHEAILKGLQKKISEFGLGGEIILLKMTSKLAPNIPNIDILHIDGNHSEQSANFDVQKWVPLVRPGGVIIFDDVGWSTGDSSNESAVRWLDQNCTRLALFREESDWGIWIKP